MTSASSQAPTTEVTLSDIVARERLRTRVGSRVLSFTPSGFDRELLDVIDNAISHRVPLGLLLPLGGTRTGVIVAAAMLVHHYVAQLGGDRRTAKVVLVTRNPTNRGFYRDLYVRDQRLVDHYPLEIVLPGGVVDTRGSLGRVLPGRFRTSAALDRLAAVQGGHDGIVVEAEAANPADVQALLESGGRIPFVYLTSNPFDPVLDTIDGLGATWAWSHRELGVLAAGSSAGDRPVCVDPTLLARAAKSTYHIVGPDEQSPLDEVIPRLFDDLRALGTREDVDRSGLMWGWAVTHTLSSCIVPLEYYERWASVAWRSVTLGEAPEKAQAFARNSQGDVSMYWEAFSDDLAHAVQAMASSVKPASLLSWLQDCTAERSLVIVRSQAMANAVRDYLEDTPGVPVDWRRKTEVSWPAALQRGATRWAPHALLAGTLTYSQSHLLCTPPVETLTILSHGPWETGRIVRQIQDTTKALYKRIGPEHRSSSHKKIFGEECIDGYDEQHPVLEVSHGRVDPAMVPKSVREAIWNPFGMRVTTDLDLDAAEDRDDVSTSTSSGNSDVNTIRVEFEDGVGHFEPDAFVSRIRDGEEKEVASKSLRPGDKVVLVDKGARTSLFDLIAETLEDLPESAPTVLLVREWRSRAHATLQLPLTYDEILDKMQDLGTRITTPGAVSHWVHGRVLGPDDPQDIRRFGEAVGDDFLVHGWRPIADAVNTLRRHRQTIGRQLARVVEQRSYTELDSDGYFDGRLGVHMSDLADVLTTHVVRTVDTTTRTVAAHMANIVLQGTTRMAAEETQ